MPARDEMYYSYWRLRILFNYLIQLPSIQSDFQLPLWGPVPSQEGHEPAWVGPEEDHEDDERAGVPLLWAQAERAGVMQTVEEKVPETL